MGGFLAHDLPEVLVNTDAHLDLFDSESEDASDYEELMEVFYLVSSKVCFSLYLVFLVR
jgi:uncharacterized protein YfkK (UPF0435 family)